MTSEGHSGGWFLRTPRVPALGPALPRRWGRPWRAFGRLGLRLLGWTIEGELPNVSRCVAVVAPHTSNWDFPVGLATMFALGLRVDWLGKAALFRGPFDGLLRALGGIPVDRHAPEGTVRHVAALFAARERVFLGLSPEGTRRKVERWKSGFHRIARAAGVPLVPVAFDWSRRTVVLMPARHATEDYERDVAELQRLFVPGMARHPDAY